ncbi:hypothetical protein ACFWZ3_15630 [Frateuria sp. GZRR35]|uniref:hypothetical protein n=1 Tax=unclassified Frateuria TaxID=2648894 RepID=UPI003EDCAA1F
MLEISESALMMSVQAIRFATRQLGIDRASAVGPDQADYDEIIEAYELAAAELRDVYEQARLQGSGLPAYSDLMGQEFSSGTS